jgi:hypothetical protein
MSKVFIAGEDNFQRTFKRKLAKGYKTLTIDEDVNTGTPIEIVTENDDTLRIKKVEDDGKEPNFVILAKQVGCIGYSQRADLDFKSKVSIISLDGESFLITLYEGALILNVNDKLVMPSVGIDEEPKASLNEIEWIDFQWFEQYMKYLKPEEYAFYYDFERFYLIGGGKTNSGSGYLSSSFFKELKDLHIDMSLGKYALYIQTKENQADAKQAKAEMKKITTAMKSNKIEFEDDDEVEFEESDDDDDDDFEEV